MILTFGTTMDLLLSLVAIIMTFWASYKALNIFRRWERSNDEERYELEKNFYLTYSVVIIVLGIRLFLVPTYFWTMQSLIPMIPGAMCLWGVFNALPTITWPALWLKLILPVGYVAWLILVKINSNCKTNPLMRTMMAFFLILTPFLLLDAVFDVNIFTNISPVEVSCCSSAIDVGDRPIPLMIGDVPGQSLLLLGFISLSAVFTVLTIAALKYPYILYGVLLFSLPLAWILILTMTEVLTPWMLNLPFHHCPFCLLLQSPLALLFFIFFYIGISMPWITFIVNIMGRSDGESEVYTAHIRTSLLKLSGFVMILSLALLSVGLSNTLS